MEAETAAGAVFSAPTWFYVIGSIASAIVILSAVIALIAWFTTARGKVQELDGFGEWKGSVNTDRKAFRTFMKEVRKELRAINKSFQELFARLDPPLLQRSSPLSLTEFGEKLAEELDAQEIAERLSPKIMQKLGQGSQAYTINDMCFDYITGDDYEPTDDEAARISKVAYEHGLKRRQLREILAVVLRDRVLQTLSARQTENTA